MAHAESTAKDNIVIRECRTVEELSECVSLQREVFALPEIELSPVRHFIVTKNAGGWALGAYDGERLVGFVLSVPAFLWGWPAFYSHMTGVRPQYQSYGIGARLKWAQRERALGEGVRYIKWTFQPVQARNAFFNLEKLGATVSEYQANFYGTDYSTAPGLGSQIGLDSDRLFAQWDLSCDKTAALADGRTFEETREIAKEIEIPNDWNTLVKEDPRGAIDIQTQIKQEFESAFAEGLVGRGFRRDPDHPKFLLYRD
jgi:predicted GNAT superfamily acetyltransferase